MVDVGGDYALETRFNFLGNYAHLVHDLLGPLCQVRRLLADDTEAPDADIRVILPKKAPGLAIRALDALEIPDVCTDGRVRGRVIEASSDQNLSMLKRIADLPIATLSDELPRKVFVSRRGKRTITNESEVWPFLEARGYARFFMEELTLEDQWSLLGRAEHVVGIHGAGLSNLAFSLHANETRAPRFRLVELHSAGYANNCFRLYAAILGGHWTGVRGRLESAIVRDLDEKEDLFAHQMASFEVDLTALEEALDFSARAEFAPANSRARAEDD